MGDSPGPRRSLAGKTSSATARKAQADIKLPNRRSVLCAPRAGLDPRRTEDCPPHPMENPAVLVSLRQPWPIECPIPPTGLASRDDSPYSRGPGPALRPARATPARMRQSRSVQGRRQGRRVAGEEFGAPFGQVGAGFLRLPVFEELLGFGGAAGLLEGQGADEVADPLPFLARPGWPGFCRAPGGRRRGLCARTGTGR